MSYSLSRGSALVQQMYGVGLTVNAELACFMKKLEGDEKSGCPIRYLDKTGLQRGSSIDVNYLIPSDDENPKGVEDESVGNEQSTPEPLKQTVRLSYAKYDQGDRNIVNDQGLVTWDLREIEMTVLSRRVSKYIERCPIRQLCGTTVYNTTVPDYRASWMNIAVAPDTNHWLRPDGVVVDGSTVTETTIAGTTTNLITGDTVRELEKRACTDSLGFTYPIIPANIPGIGNYYLMILSPDGFAQLIDNTSASLIHTLELGLLQGGGDYNNNPAVNIRAVNIHNTVCVRHPLMPLGQSSATAFRSNVERSVFMGANALTCIYGEGFTNGNHWGFAEFQKLRQWTGMTDTVQGGTVAIVNGLRFATVVVSHYSTRTTSSSVIGG